ncbi:MAG: NAD-binding protein [Treponema sp.]|nr:NAD-binding protein [Treponema sp.]
MIGKVNKQKKLKHFKKLLWAVLKNPLTYAVIAFPFLMLLMIQIAYRAEMGHDTLNSMGDSVWNFLIAFVAGYYDICVVTPLGRLCSFVILISGILVFSTMNGKIASVFTEAQMKKDKGLGKLKNMNKHFLLCGWRPGLERILEFVLYTNPDIEPDQIVLVNEAQPESIEQITSQLKFKGIKYVAGDFTDADVLTRALVKKAERALIISDQSKDATKLAMDSKSVLSVLTMKNLNPKIYIAAEIFDKKFENHLRLAHCDEVILTADYEYSLLATASSGKGYSNVIKELIAEDPETGILIEEIPQSFIGKTYKEFVNSLRPISETNSVLIGLLLNTGNFYQRRKDAVREAQKDPNVDKIIDNLVKVKTLKSNEPLFTPPSTFVIQPNTSAIFVKGKPLGE